MKSEPESNSSHGANKLIMSGRGRHVFRKVMNVDSSDDSDNERITSGADIDGVKSERESNSANKLIMSGRGRHVFRKVMTIN